VARYGKPAGRIDGVDVRITEMKSEKGAAKGDGRCVTAIAAGRQARDRRVEALPNAIQKPAHRLDAGACRA